MNKTKDEGWRRIREKKEMRNVNPITNKNQREQLEKGILKIETRLRLSQNLRPQQSLPRIIPQIKALALIRSISYFERFFDPIDDTSLSNIYRCISKLTNVAQRCTL